MKNIKFLIAAGIAFSALILPFGNNAVAAKITLTAGPVPVPTVPVEACIGNNCLTTPDLSTITVKAVVKVKRAINLLPTIVPGICPFGQMGAVLHVTAGDTRVKVKAKISGQLPDGATFNETIGPVKVKPLTTVAISACANINTPI